ncbi:MAG: insulinase family protein [Gammaproteobacteria bacterium]|nr:MAG: insulinase family protein [Gammaproteobacteria bacterium]
MYAERMKMVGLRLGVFVLACLFQAAASAMAPIQHWTTRNGARVYFVPAHDLPMVDVRVVFDAGSARDGKHPGVARLTNALLATGAGKLDADALAEGLESVGAELDNGALRDMAWLTLRSLTEPRALRKAVSLFGLIVQHPRFDAEDFRRERERLRVSLQLDAQQPGRIAERAFYRAVYDGHPYANPVKGTEKGLAALRRRDVLDFHHRFYVARNAVVAIVGDLDRQRAERLAEAVVGALPAGRRAPALPPVKDLAAPREVRIAHEATQAHILCGQPGMRRGDPDYFPLYVGNYILGGGGLVSRISREVREKRGLSYSAYSYFLPMARRGPFILGLQTRADQADEALRVLRRTLAEFVSRGPTEAELQAAIRHITGSYPLRIDSNRKILEYVAMIGFYDLPLDYLERFNARVAAVTRRQVMDAFRRRVHPDRLVTVVVGAR